MFKFTFNSYYWNESDFVYLIDYSSHWYDFIYLILSGCIIVIICAALIYFTNKDTAKYIDPVLSLVSAAVIMVLSYPYSKYFLNTYNSFIMSEYLFFSDRKLPYTASNDPRHNQYWSAESWTSQSFSWCNKRSWFPHLATDCKQNIFNCSHYLWKSESEYFFLKYHR